MGESNQVEAAMVVERGAWGVGHGAGISRTSAFPLFSQPTKHFKWKFFPTVRNTKAARPSGKYWQPSPSLMPIISAQSTERKSQKKKNRKKNEETRERKANGICRENQRKLQGKVDGNLRLELFFKQSHGSSLLIIRHVDAVSQRCTRSAAVAVAANWLCVLIKPSINLRLLAPNAKRENKEN